MHQCRLLEPFLLGRPTLLQAGLAALQTTALPLPWDFPSLSDVKAKAWDPLTGKTKATPLPFTVPKPLDSWDTSPARAEIYQGMWKRGKVSQSHSVTAVIKEYKQNVSLHSAVKQILRAFCGNNTLDSETEIHLNSGFKIPCHLYVIS